MVIMASATSVDEARRAIAEGVDMVIAQGYEAGGHRGIFDPHGDDRQMSTLTLVQALKRTVSIPVIAAGGSWTARDPQHDASGRRRGSTGDRVPALPESATDVGYRQALSGEPAPKP